MPIKASIAKLVKSEEFPVKNFGDECCAKATAKLSWWQRLMVLIKSSGVGLAATASDLGTTTLLVRCFSFSKELANIPGLVPGIAVMFIGNKYFAFQDKSKKVLRQGALFVAIEAVSFALNALFFHLLVTWWDWHEIFARLLSTNITYLAFSFPMWNWLVFKLPGTKIGTEAKPAKT